jgi:methylmalonyl-CoA/ethylmalonyl-CoA epimerase
MTYIHPKDSNGILWQLFSMLPGKGVSEDRTAVPGGLGSVRFDHVSMAVDDLDQQVEWQTRVLGMEALRRWQDDQLGYKAALMTIPGSELEFEIMEPLNDASFVQKFINERGTGLHHVCVEVESTEGAAKALENAGITPFGGIIDNGWKKHTFIHPKDSGGVLFQLFEERDD